MERIELTRESDETYQQGNIFRHNISKSTVSKNIVTFRFLATVFVDDKTAQLISREQLVKDLLII